MSYLMLPTEALTEHANGTTWSPQSGGDRRGQRMIAWLALVVVGLGVGVAMLMA